MHRVQPADRTNWRAFSFPKYAGILEGLNRTGTALLVLPMLLAALLSHRLSPGLGNGHRGARLCSRVLDCVSAFHAAALLRPPKREPGLGSDPALSLLWYAQHRKSGRAPELSDCRAWPTLRLQGTTRVCRLACIAHQAA